MRLVYCFLLLSGFSAVFASSSDTSPVSGVSVAELTPTKKAAVMYRNWLGGLLSFKSTRAPVAVPLNDEWTIIELIQKGSPAFDQCFDPAVSGDWSEAFIEIGGSYASLSEVPCDSESEDDFDLMEELPDGPKSHQLGPLEEDEDFGQLDEEFERRILWLSVVDAEIDRTLASFDATRGVELTDTVLKGVIDRDILRTYPEEIQPDVAEILYAYSHRNPLVGYSQGMNYLVSFFLQQKHEGQGLFSNSEVFNLLTYIVENVNLDYYDATLSGFHSDCHRFREFVRMYSPHKEYKVYLEAILPDAILTMYTKLLPHTSIAHYMDFLCLHGGRIASFALHLAMLDLAWSSVDLAVESADPGLEMAMGGLEFRIESIRIGTLHMDGWLDRAKAYLVTHGREIADLLAAPVVLPTRPMKVVKPPHVRRPARKIADQDDSFFNHRSRPTRLGLLRRNKGQVVVEQPREWIVEKPDNRLDETVHGEERFPTAQDDIEQLYTNPVRAITSWWNDFKQVMQNHQSSDADFYPEGYV